MFLLIRRSSGGLTAQCTNLHSTMFLLIQHEKNCAIWRTKRFTFHNVSINTPTTSLISLSIFHLHSTMFLLILTSPASRRLRHSSFTFHNVSINTNLRGFDASDVEIFTFHNVSINTLAVDQDDPQRNQFTFHNVSINTQLAPIWDAVSEQIYIPQCFY